MSSRLASMGLGAPPTTPAPSTSATGASGTPATQPGEESATARCPELVSQVQVIGAMARTLSSTVPW